ncbi:hypothetical protein IRJ41_016172, partial [Triplophysa rosa]
EVPEVNAAHRSNSKDRLSEEKVTGREGGKERYALQADKSVIQADSFDSGKRQNKERAEREESELKDGRKLQTVRADSARYDISF